MLSELSKFSNRQRGPKSVALFQPLESRQMFAAGTKIVDVGGPVEDMVESGGQVFVSTRHASGSSVDQIYVANGIKGKTRMLLDLTTSDAKISSIGEMAATDDGRVFFTANGAGGHHIFELNTVSGGYKQISTGTNVWFKNLTTAGKAMFVYESNNEVIGRVGPGGKTVASVIQQEVRSQFFAAGNVVFFTAPDQGLYRCNGTAAGTVKVSGEMSVGSSDVFTASDYVYFEGTHNNDTSFYRTGLTGTAPQLLASDFALSNTSHAELNDYVYFAGMYYNTSPNAKGQELYRVRMLDGMVEIAADTNTSSGGAVEGISAIGNSVYFVNSDGEFINSQGTYDRELFKFDSVKKTTTKVTNDNTLYPIEVGGGALGYYYFVAAPTKDDARWGSRALFRTDPVTDKVELVSGVPTVQDSNGKDYQEVHSLAVGSRGLFFTADSALMGRETDVFFVSTPFSQIDPVSTILTIQATEAADVLTMKVVGSELLVTLNGVEERHQLSKIGRIEAFLKEGDDSFTSDANVTVNTYVFGDLGNDNITTGGGQDTITGGAGKNQLFGGEGADRLNGSGGRDSLDGQGGEDRVYGNGGSDNLIGGAGIDRLFGGDGDDILSGGSSNDKLYGEAGNDFLYGGNQSDLMFGGTGDDYLDGAIGKDTLDGEAGIDQLFGGDGDDILNAKDGQADKLSGDAGTDIAYADNNESSVVLTEDLR